MNKCLLLTGLALTIGIGLLSLSAPAEATALTPEQLIAVQGHGCTWHCTDWRPSCTEPIWDCDAVNCYLYCTGTVKLGQMGPWHAKCTETGGWADDCTYIQTVTCKIYDCHCDYDPDPNECKADMDDQEGQEVNQICRLST